MSQSPRVLIVEDDADLAEVTCEVMALAGATAIYRTSITEALEALALHADTIVALFTDIHMHSPVTGVDLAIHVAAEWPDMAICVTSGVSSERPKRLPDQASFVAKPWRTDDIVAFLHSAGIGAGHERHPPAG